MNLTNEDLKNLWTRQLLRGDVIEVMFQNGNSGRVYVQRNDYAMSEQFVFEVVEGWCAGMVEPICDTDSKYIETFLNDAVSIHATTRRVPAAEA